MDVLVVLQSTTGKNSMDVESKKVGERKRKRGGGEGERTVLRKKKRSKKS